jgi:hypothetical protein
MYEPCTQHKLQRVDGLIRNRLAVNTAQPHRFEQGPSMSQRSLQDHC